MIIYLSRDIDITTKGTYRVETRGVRGPPRAAKLSVVAGGCSHAMVGAQLWLGRSSAARKAECGHGVDSPSPINGCWCRLTKRGIMLSKNEIEGDLRNDERKQT